MNPLSSAVLRFSARARKKRIEVFRSLFTITRDTKLLDYGSEHGANIANYLEGLDYDPKNVYIADIEEDSLQEGRRRYGFNPVLIGETGSLPFEDSFFDIVFCSSVIEHTTLDKSEIWAVTDSAEFKRRSWARQQAVADEITRLGRQYFVQTPSRSFPIESHTWLPMVGYLPREQFVPLLSFTNRFWIKRSTPDFNLLDGNQMRALFPDAEIVAEKKLFFVKSIMAIKTDAGRS